MVNRIVTGSHFGLRDWLVQRVTAFIMLLYLAGITVYTLVFLPRGYDGWTMLFSYNLVKTFTLFFLMCLFYHAWIGVRDVVMDYVRPAFIRLLLHMGVIVSLFLYTIWSVQILWGM